MEIEAELDIQSKNKYDRKLFLYEHKILVQKILIKKIWSKEILGQTRLKLKVLSLESFWFLPLSSRVKGED